MENNNLMIKIMWLPDDVINYIKEFIRIKDIVFVNKTYYNLYHSIIKSNIVNYETYIRDTIRRDNVFVFKKIVTENYKKWLETKNYIYKNLIYKTYCYFVINYCIENESTNCRNYINLFLKELGLCKNQHKKNFVKYIRWRN
jgi:hypothetical protein